MSNYTQDIVKSSVRAIKALSQPYLKERRDSNDTNNHHSYHLSNNNILLHYHHFPIKTPSHAYTR
jgi:hypothetical protein